MTVTALIVIVSTSSAWSAEPVSPPAESGMKSIFNGEDLSGWDGDPRLWSVKDGAIRGETTSQNPSKGNTFLIWQGGQVGDFELRLSFRCTNTNNSGIQYRSTHVKEGDRIGNDWVVRGYQHEIRNENQLPSVSGFIYDEGGKRGRTCLVGEKAVWDKDGKKVIDTLIDQEAFEKLFRLNEWNDVVIRAEGNRIQHFMNDRLILDFTDKHPELARAEGILALQLHGGKPMWVEYKDVRLKELE